MKKLEVKISTIKYLFIGVIILSVLTFALIKIPRYKIIEGLLRYAKVFDIFFIPLSFHKDNLETIDIEIKPNDLEKLRSYNFNRNDELAKKTVPAVVTIGGKIYNAKVKNRGQNENHWVEQKRSWRIKLAKDSYWKGMREFNLIIPYDRGYFSEQFSFTVAQKLGLKPPRSEFVTNTINSGTKAVYFLTQQWDKDMLEYNSLGSDTDLYSDKNTPVNSNGQWGIYNDVANFEKKVSIEGRENDFSNLDNLLKIIKSDKNIFDNSIGDILDLDNALAWVAHSTLVFTRGQQFSHNIFLYFDRMQGRFQLIPWNVDMDRTKSIENHSIDEYYNPLMGKLLENDEFTHKRNRLMWDYLTNGQNITQDLKSIDLWNKTIIPSFLTDRKKKYSNLDVIYNSLLLKQNTNKGYLKILNALNETKASVIISKVNERDYHIAITSSGFSSVKLSQINMLSGTNYKLYNSSDLLLYDNTKDESLASKEILIHSKRVRPDTYFLEMKLEPQTQIFTLKSEQNIQDYPSVGLQNAITGKEVKFDLKNDYSSSRDKNITIDNENNMQKMQKPNWLIQSGKNNFFIKKGLFEVSQNLVLPANSVLMVDSGVTLRLNPKVSIISYGNVFFNGTVNSPIKIVRNYTENFGTVACVRTAYQNLDQKCNFDHVYIDGGSEAELNGAYFTGAIASHGVSFNANYLTVVNSQGDDSVNVKNAPLYISHARIHQNTYDGIDGDFNPFGEIRDSEVYDNGNDGLDLGSAILKVENVSLSNNGDKCISAGERTDVIINNIVAQNCPIGIAIKDAAKVSLANSVIKDLPIAISQYVKKSLFGDVKPIFTENNVEYKNISLHKYETL